MKWSSTNFTGKTIRGREVLTGMYQTQALDSAGAEQNADYTAPQWV
jgi:hypothetical protein